VLLWLPRRRRKDPSGTTSTAVRTRSQSRQESVAIWPGFATVRTTKQAPSPRVSRERVEFTRVEGIEPPDSGLPCMRRSLSLAPHFRRPTDTSTTKASV